MVSGKTTGRKTMVVAIYDPPKPGLPYLVASFTEDGVEILQARDKNTARELVIKLRSKAED